MTTGEVINETFFHTSVTIKGQNNFDNNSTITIDREKYNPRYNDLINFAPTANLSTGKLGWLKYLDYLIDNNKANGKPSNWADLLEKITNISYRINNRYYEKIFEEIRQSEFNKLPSRYSCIYLADKDNIEFWHTKALEQLELQELPIYEFKATGQIHYADAEWLEIDIVSDDDYRNVARQYWEGKPCPTAKEDRREILFCGTLTRIIKYNNLNDFKNRQ
jgi:hypothetical protein